MEDVFEILLLIHHSVASAWNNAFLGSDLGHFIFSITKMSVSNRNNPLIYQKKKKKNNQSTAQQQFNNNKNSPKTSLEAAWLNNSEAVIIYAFQSYSTYWSHFSRQWT